MTKHAGSPTSSRGRTSLYWIATLLLGTECVVGGVMAVLRFPYYANNIVHLGYPVYLMTILGAWYLLAGLALLVPRLPLLKEWAYAGLIFNYTGAAASHVAVGNGTGALVAPVIFTALVITSWALRPSSRRVVPE